MSISRNILFFIFLSISFYCSSQKINKDSLWEVWENKNLADTTRMKAILAISWEGYLFTQPDSAYYFAQLHYDYAKKVNNKNHMSTALNTQGISFIIRGDYKNALKYLNDCLSIKEEIKDTSGIAATLNNMGNIFKEQGDYANAIDYFTRSLTTKESIKNKTKGDWQGIGASYNNIGNIYRIQHDYEKALEYYNKSLKIQEDIGNKKDLGSPLNNIGTTYFEMNNFEKALEFYQRALKIKEEAGDQQGIATCLNNIGLVLQNQKKLSEALEYFQKSLSIRESMGDKQGISASFNNIGSIYQNLGQHSKAIDFGKKALSLAKETGAIVVLRDAYKTLFESYEATEQWKQSLEMHQLYIEMRDSILSEQNQQEVLRQQFQYDFDKKTALEKTTHKIELEKQKALAKNEKEKQEAITLEREQKQQVIIYAVSLGLILVIAFAFFIINRLQLTRKQKELIESQKEIVDIKNREITDSINYAKRIQSGLLTPDEEFRKSFTDHFIFYQPKDIVSGDFYWLINVKTTPKSGESNRVSVLAVADCTGHGVPGSLMSVVGYTLLNQTLKNPEINTPADTLDHLNRELPKNFKKHNQDEIVRDGMDAVVCAFDFTNLKLYFSGAKNPIYIVRENELTEYKGDPHSISASNDADKNSFSNQAIPLQKNDCVFMFTDGYADQFGGPKGKKFMYKPLKNLLASICEKPMKEQLEIVRNTFSKWKGNLEQVDDVCIIGIKI